MAKVPEELRPESQSVAETVVALLFYALVFFVLGTAAGIWWRLFWVGWVLAP